MTSHRLCAAIILAAITWLAGAVTWAQGIDRLVLMTESYPPMNYEQDGTLKGISVDLMDRMLKITGSGLDRGDIRLMPWARAYRDLQEKENTVLFLMNRNKSREHLFKWVGPVVTLKYVMIARKERNIRINSVSDFQHYRIGVVSKDLGELLVKEMKVQPFSIEPVPSGELNLMKLNRNRIDLWIYDETVAKWIILDNGCDLKDYEIVYTLDNKSTSFFAFHRNIDDSIIKKFQYALDALKATVSENGKSEFQNIVDKYTLKDDLDNAEPPRK